MFERSGRERWTRVRLSTRVVFGSGGLLLSLVTGGGIAAASPDVNALASSTCTYPQVMAALNAQSPEAANELSSSPMANAWLQELVASPPDKRVQMVADVQAMPALQQYTGLISQITATCANY